MRRRGLTVSEVLIALALAAIAVLGLASLTAAVWRAAKFSKYTAYASNLARQPLEQMKGDAAYFRTTMDGPAEGRQFSKDFEVDEGQAVRFDVELTFTRLPAPQDRYVQVESKVKWVQQKTPRQVFLETILPVPR